MDIKTVNSENLSNKNALSTRNSQNNIPLGSQFNILVQSLKHNNPLQPQSADDFLKNLNQLNLQQSMAKLEQSITQMLKNKKHEEFNTFANMLDKPIKFKSNQWFYNPEDNPQREVAQTEIKLKNSCTQMRVVIKNLNNQVINSNKIALDEAKTTNSLINFNLAQLCKEIPTAQAVNLEFFSSMDGVNYSAEDKVWVTTRCDMVSNREDGVFLQRGWLKYKSEDVEALYAKRHATPKEKYQNYMRELAPENNNLVDENAHLHAAPHILA